MGEVKRRLSVIPLPVAGGFAELVTMLHDMKLNAKQALLLIGSGRNRDQFIVFLYFPKTHCGVSRYQTDSAIPPIYKSLRWPLLPLLLVQMADARVELLLQQQINNVAGGNRLRLHCGDKTGMGYVSKR